MIFGERANKKILIVDDGVANLKLAECHLKQQGYLVTTASNGKDALLLVEENDFDMILLDIMMSGLNGFEVCKILKANDVTKDIPVIFLTILSDVDDILKGFEIGGIDYITKPFNGLELVARVKANLMNVDIWKKQMRINQRLRVAELDLLAFLEAVHSGLVIIDPDDNKIVDVNAGALELFGVPITDVVGRNYSEFFTSEAGDSNILLNSSEDSFCIESCLAAPNGKVFDLIQKVTEVKTSIKPFLLLNFIDITDRKKVELLREDISRVVQHDLKNPLNAIVALPEIIKSSLGLDEKDAMMLNLIEEAGYQMLDMINMSLDMYKMECGTYKVTKVPVGLVTVFRKIMREQQSVIAYKELNVSFVLDGKGVCENEEFFVQSEELLSYSLFSNLFKNAMDASPVGDTITIDFADGDRNSVAIHNMGAVPEDIRDTFFDKYTTSGKTGGTGLGTYSAKLIATALGGGIKMKSSEEAGTTVTVEIVN